MSGRIHAQDIVVPFADIDQARVLYFPHVFHYCHLVMEGFFGAAVGIPYHRFLEEQGMGLPTVHAEADYASPVRYGTVLRAALSVMTVGRTSAGLRFRFSSKEGLHAEARNTVVCVRLAEFRATPWEEPLRGVLLDYLEGTANPDAARK